ncbi:MAG: hypothetical protein H6505_02995 [Calditrichaeota bacterium]|nr:hypothetical protein [Calditrichota bacterium]
MKKLLLMLVVAFILGGTLPLLAQDTAPAPTKKEELANEADSLEARRRAMREEQTMLDKQALELKQEIADLTARLQAAKLELKSNGVSQKDLSKRMKELKIDTKQHKMESKQAKRAEKDAKRAAKEAKKNK